MIREFAGSEQAFGVPAPIGYNPSGTMSNTGVISLEPALFGGELIHKTEYGHEPHEYKRAAAALNAVAGAFNTEPTADEVDYWDMIFRTVKALDNLVDNDGVNDLSGTINSMLRHEPVDGVDADLADRFAIQLGNMTEQRRGGICNALEMIPEYARDKKAARTPKELAAVGLEEARCCASQLLLESTGSPLVDERRESFNYWLLQSAQAGEMIDTALDLRRDYAEGLVSVRPTVLNAARIAKEGLPYLGATLRGMDRAAIKQLGSCVAACVSDRVRG